MDETEQKFLDLLEAHRNIIYKVCLMFSENNDSLNDIYQDVVLNLWRSYPQFRGDSKAGTWVYRIALNTCVSQIRKVKRLPQTMPITVNVATIIDDADEYQARVRELYRLIGQLGTLDRALILLWLDEKSYDEMAEMLGLSKNNIGVRLNRIREKLKKMSNQ